MRVISDRAGVRFDSMAEGETFIYANDYWLVTDYVDEYDNILCVNLSSGHTEFLVQSLVVVPVTAEVHIL